MDAPTPHFIDADPYPWPWNGDLRPDNTALIRVVFSARSPSQPR